MSELAVNQYGKAFALPIEAKYWLVRKMSDVPRGGPVPTFDAAGRPIVISIETTMDQFHALLRSQGCLPGRYRLDALDGAQSPMKDAIAYLPFPPMMGRVARAAAPEAEDERPRTPAPAAASVWSTGGPWPLPVPAHMTGVEYLLGEALRGQLEMHAATTTALVQAQAGMAGMMVAAAELMRAADGAGLPKRKPNGLREEPAPRPPQVIVQQVAPPAVEAYEDDEEDGDDDPPEPPKPAGWQDKLAEVFSELAPMAKVMIASKLGDMVSGGHDGAAATTSGNAYRNAVPVPAPAPAPVVAEPEPEDDEPEVDLSPAAWSHLQLVEMRLGPEQGQALREELDRMAPDVRREFALGLMSLKLDAACDHVVGQLAVLDARRARAQAAAQRAAMRADDVRAHVESDGLGADPAGQLATVIGSASFDQSGEGGELDPQTAAALGLNVHAQHAVPPNAPSADDPIAVPPGYQIARIVRGKDGQRFAHLRPVHATSANGEGAAQMRERRDAGDSGDEQVGALVPMMAPEVEASQQEPHALGAMERLMEILPKLTPQERATAQSIAVSLPDPVRQGLLSKLVAVPLDEAVAVVKSIVAKHDARPS